MPKIYPSSQLHDVASALDDFIAVGEQLSQDRDNVDLRHRLAEIAGRIHEASKIANSYAVYTAPPVAGGRSMTYDPLTNWDSQIDPFLDPLQDALDHAYRVRGTIRAKAQEAERAEKSLVGRVASVVGFPARVREHIAERGGSVRYQQTGFWVVVVIELVIGLFVTVAGGLVLAQLATG